MEPFPLVSHGARLRAFLLPPRDGPLLVFCHGFPGRDFNDAVARALHARGLGALLFRYRGAHGSEGAFRFEHAREDVVAALEAARPLAPRGVGLLGYSMGGFHAVRALHERPDLADLLVLQAALTDAGALWRRIGEMALEPFLASGLPYHRAALADLVAEARAALPEEEPIRLAPALRQPTLLLHGARDDVVPPDQSRAMRAALRAPARLVELDAGHHFEGQAARAAEEIALFAREHLPPAKGARAQGAPGTGAG